MSEDHRGLKKKSFSMKCPFCHKFVPIKRRYKISKIISKGAHELRKARLKRGMLVKELAQEASIAPSKLCWIELGKLPLTELSARKLGEVLEVDYKKFLRK
jgi:ribosome-binding protein aMBF1 (putative translation factor)